VLWYSIRFTHGPVLYGKHASMDVEKDGFGVAGFNGGQVELDNIKLWSIKEAKGESWSTHMRRFKPMAHKTLKPEKVKG